MPVTVEHLEHPGRPWRTEMAAWPEDELRRIAETDDLHVAPFREDGTTYGTPTWIWPVVVDERVDERVDHRVDEAYRKKYRGSPYLAAMIGPRARAATVRITPRQVDTP
jgi:hypothetical protein